MRALFCQISTSCSKPILTKSPSAIAVCIATSSGSASRLLDDDAVLQHKGIRVDRVVAVDQDRVVVSRRRSGRSGRRS